MATSRERDDTRRYTFAGFVKDEASLQSLQTVFHSETVADTHAQIGDVATAIAWLKKQSRSPQRLFVDISSSSRPLDELDELADACEPSVQVYVLGERNDVGLYRNLLARGVQDYVVKPLGPELVRRILLQSDAELVRRGRYGKVMALMGTRGGVGTTSIAAHLSRALAAGGARRRVVYLDFNVYDSSGATILGRPGGTALLDLLGNIDRLDQEYLERTLADAGEGLFVLAAELEYTDEFHPDPAAVVALLNALCQYFHYVVVDLPFRGGALAGDVVQQSALVGLVSDTSVHSARTLSRLMRHVEGRANPPTVLTVLNHARPQSRHDVHNKDFRETTEIVVQVSIGFDAKGPILAENLSETLPAGSEFARGIRTLADLVTGEGQAVSSGSWWQRLTGKAGKAK